MDARELRPVINAWGTATPYGVSRSAPEVCAAVADALGRYYVMAELQQACAQRLVAWSGAPAACVTHCTASAITLATAACMAGSDAARIAQLPDVATLSHHVLLLQEHDVAYGQRLTQAIRLSGATPIRCDSLAALEARLDAGGVACVFAVESHLAPGSGPETTRALAALCRGRVPLVLDAAAQDRRVSELVTSGADLILLSAQKYLAAPTAGIVLGTPELVASVDAQHGGIGRGMKPSKEALAGVMAAVEVRANEDAAERKRVEREKIDIVMAAARSWRGIEASVEADPVGNDTERVWLRVDERAAGAPAGELARRLRDGDTAIATAPHRLQRGHLGLELSGATVDEVRVLCGEIQRLLGEA
jgi:L-seryl-tRNA(Ser) seleniumtransferase